MVFRTEPSAATIARLERENLELRSRATRAIDAERIVEWLHEDPRRAASTAFTAGPERDLAREIEDAMANYVRKPHPSPGSSDGDDPVRYPVHKQ